MYNTVPPFNNRVLKQTTDHVPSNRPKSEWTVLTFDWDAESTLDHLKSPSVHHGDARFTWKAPSNQSSHGEEFIALGKHQALKATGERRFQDLAQAERTLREKTDFMDFRDNQQTSIPYIIGGAAFHQFNIDPTWSAFGSSQFILPQLVVGKDRNEQGYLRFILPSKDAITWLENARTVQNTQNDAFLRAELAQLLKTGSSVSTDTHNSSSPWNDGVSIRHRLKQAASQQKNVWISRFEKAIEVIQQSSITKVVLARQVKVDGVTTDERAHLKRSLQEKYQNCIHFCVEPTESASFFGATPERLLRLQGRDLHIDALAGSRSRGRTSTEDEKLSKDLLHADKDAKEHDIVKRQILEVLEPFSKQLRYPSAPLLKKLPNVQHLHTPIEAELEHSTSVFDLIEQLHPTPAVGGYPKQEALGVIEQMEPQNRGWYAGIVGWVSEQGDADIAVSIRSASHMKDTLTLYAGCGLVEGSIPEQEWDETYVKLAPFFEAAEDVAHV
jgi:menaquinone-specific isochorismate synthase